MIAVAVLHRVPHGHVRVQAALWMYLASLSADLAWRWLCRRAPNGGSYARHRRVLAVLVASCSVATSYSSALHVLFDEAWQPPAGWLGALRHAATLAIASRVLTQFVSWCTCQRVM